MMPNPKPSGFTLIELAIVLVIIGLLAAGVLVGRGMIRQAEIRATVGEADKMVKAMVAFRDKYKQFPGDFTRAEEFWGADTGCPNTAFNTTPKQASCNGNGNGTTAYDAAEAYEAPRLWQHLANAGMLEGRFSGVADNVTREQLYGTTWPISAYPGGAYAIYFAYVQSTTADEFVMPPSHALALGAVDSTTCSGGSDWTDCLPRAPLFTPEDALEIDTKVDDGRPGSGKVRSYPKDSTLTPSCATTTDATTAAYDVAFTTAACALLMQTGF